MIFLKAHWKAFIAALAIPLAAGGFSAWLSGDMGSFDTLQKPPLSPPGWLFPAAWTLLYLMMGAASWRIYVLRYPVRARSSALKLYGAQLAANALWPVLFFRFGLYWASAVWLGLLIILVALTLSSFRRLDDLAGLLLWPYLLWCCFALYLNIGAAVLN